MGFPQQVLGHALRRLGRFPGHLTHLGWCLGGLERGGGWRGGIALGFAWMGFGLKHWCVWALVVEEMWTVLA